MSVIGQLAAIGKIWGVLHSGYNASILFL